MNSIAFYGIINSPHQLEILVLISHNQGKGNKGNNWNDGNGYMVCNVHHESRKFLFKNIIIAREN